jgi:hypothetical protein
MRGTFVQLTGSRAHEWLCIGEPHVSPPRDDDADAADAVPNVFSYNTVTDTWSHDSVMTMYRIDAAIAAITTTTTTTTTTSGEIQQKHGDGNDDEPAAAMATVYAFSGTLRRSYGERTYENECYNPVTRTWTPLYATMHRSRAGAAAIWIPHWHAFIITGGGGSIFDDDDDDHEHIDAPSIEVYVPATGIFTLLSSRQWRLPRRESGHSLQLMHDNILVMTARARNNDVPVPLGWMIDLAPYVTLADMLNTMTPLKWQPLPLPQRPVDNIVYDITASLIA